VAADDWMRFTRWGAPHTGFPPRAGRARPRIAVDAAGGDGGPGPVIEGALQVAGELDIALVGPSETIRDTTGPLPPAVTVLDAPEAIGMADDPITAIRSKRGSSLLVAAAAVARGEADAMVTAGNTGAVVLAAAARLRRIPGVLSPALATLIPVPGAQPTVLVDSGATTACAPAWLVQFARMGARYATVRLGIDRPRIGLLSNGQEDVKGGPLQKTVHQQLADLPGYLGQIEAYDILSDQVDVAVTDGFTGDVALKTYERTLDVAARAASAAVREFAPDYADTHAARTTAAVWSALAPEGAAVLLGVRGLCVKCHGDAPAYDVAAAVRLAGHCVDAEVTRNVIDLFAAPVEA